MFKKALLYSVMIGLMLNNPAFAQKKVIKLTPRQAISYYAQRGNVEKLKELTQKYNIDLTDADGNTALCESILKKDKKGFKTLLELGADKKATCVEKIPEETYNDFINSSEKTTAPSISSKTTKGVPLAAEETGTFLGMGALGWGITGTVVAGGVIAAAAGGGGGGGSSNNSSNETPTKPENVCLDYPLTTCPTNANCSSCPDDSTKLKVVSCEDGYDFYGTNECHVTLACENGTQQGNSCVCNDGYELIGNVCTIKSCPINYYKSNNTCIACPANSSSPAGSISFEQCSCDSGYIMMNGSCVIQESKAGYIFKNGTDLNTTVHVNNEYISINTTDLSDITKGIFYLSSNNDNIIPTLENNAKIALLKDEEHSFSIYGVNLLNSSLVNNGEIVVEEASGVKALSSSVTNNNSLTFSGTNRYGIYGDEATIENNGTIVSSTGGYGIYASNSTIYNRANASIRLSAPSSPKTTYGIYAIGSNIGNYGNITSNGYGDFYGIYASNSTIFNDKISLIELTKSADMVYGNYAIDSTVENNGTIKLLGSKNVVGIYVERGSVYNGANSNIEIKASGGSSAIAYGGYAVDSSFTHLGTIKLLGSSVGTAYGLYSNGNTSNVNLNGVIEVLPSYASAIYGIHATGGNIIAGEKSVINIKSSSADAYKAYGVYGTDLNFEHSGSITVLAETPINSRASLTSYGIYMINGSVDNKKDSTINVTASSESSYNLPKAYGIYGKNTEIKNNGNIIVHSSSWHDREGDAVSYGIYADGGSVVNQKNGLIEIKSSKNSYSGYGIYGKNAIIENYGTIKASGTAGIYAEGGTVYNEGTIIMGGTYTGNEANGKFIVLENGATMATSGILASTGTLNLSSFSTDGTGSVYLLNGGNLKAESIIGDLHIDKTNVASGFDTIYTAKDAVQANDTTGLNLISDSHLFNASLADNGKDVLMTMKSFDEVTSNKSLAGFLESNYANGNNEAFFNDIKSLGNATAFTSAMDSLTGRDTIAKFTHEDLTAMREVNFAMNELMFANNDKPMFETNGSLNAFNFKNDNNSSAQYALANKRISPRMKIGYAMSTTNLNTDNDDDTTRRNSVFQVFAPISYDRSGVQMIATPQIGFARGHYTRKGYNGTSYEGVIEKRIFALMNEARYPMTVGKFELAPTVEFNAIAYNTKGSEDEKAYSLTMPSDNSLSVEAGLGIYAKRNIGNMKFNAGLMVYREFADPYNIKMGMNGMEGTFDLYDNRSEYRGVASFGFGYDVGKLNVYGNVQHFMETDTNTKFKAGLKFGF